MFAQRIRSGRATRALRVVIRQLINHYGSKEKEGEEELEEAQIISLTKRPLRGRFYLREEIAGAFVVG
jgi:hypothetical protein